MNKFFNLVLVGTLLAASLLSGCGGEQKTSGSGGQAQTIKVATTPQYKPFVYVNENDELAGYEADLINAVFERLPQYELAFVYTDWQSVLTGLDSGLYHISMESIFYTEERAEKYFYSDPIFYDPIVAVTAENTKPIQSFDDLQGETIPAQPGDLWAGAAQKYNEANPDTLPIQIDYSDSDRFQMFAKAEEGLHILLTDYGTYAGVTADTDFKVQQNILDQAAIEDYIESSYTYFLLSKGEENRQLLEDVNQALADVMADGTASAISQKYFGDDYTPVNHSQ